ncbi:MAG: hypothetical protein JWO36_2137 [Myxococcales bacterium]|nr:hypothetical protein [Myxococcales bacterium]
MSIARLTLRTWLRYLVPLTLASALVLGAVIWIALRVLKLDVGSVLSVSFADRPVPDLAEHARGNLRLGWELVGITWVAQLMLVAAVAPAVRGLATNVPLTQLRALSSGLRTTIQAIVPCLVAVVAIAIGSMALVIPGLALLVLLSMTGASDKLGDPLPAPLADSVVAARGQWLRVAAIVFGLLVLDVAIGGIAQLAFLRRIPQPMTTAAMLHSRTFVRAIVLALIALSPLPACALAAAYQQRRS